MKKLLLVALLSVSVASVYALDKATCASVSQAIVKGGGKQASNGKKGEKGGLTDAQYDACVKG